MEQVTLETLDAFIERYAKARGGERNEETDSEAMFVFRSKYGGAFVLNTGLGAVWVGLQNASARCSDYGKPFPSVHAALHWALTSNGFTSIDSAVFYSEDSIARLRFLADQIERYRADDSVLLVA